jgi:hypothetical protein
MFVMSDDFFINIDHNFVGKGASCVWETGAAKNGADKPAAADGWGVLTSKTAVASGDTAEVAVPSTGAGTFKMFSVKSLAVTQNSCTTDTVPINAKGCVLVPTESELLLESYLDPAILSKLLDVCDDFFY